MKIKELIEKLSILPEETLVLVDGYEDNLSDVSEPKLINVDLNVNTEEYYGPHSENQNGKITAVVLHRKPNIRI